MSATYALLGHPLSFSLSPAMHRAAFRARGIDARYELRPTPPEGLRDALEALRRGDLAGANVTIPHKVAAAQLVEDESGVVRRVGAVNTILRTPEGFLRGENTDASGFLHVLRGLGMDDGRGRRAALLGAGGAARAVGGVLLQAGYALDVLNRSAGRSGVLASQLYRHFRGAMINTAPFDEATILELGARADLLVNATPLGAAPEVEASPWPRSAPIPASLTVIDLVAWPTDTALVWHAREGGARAEGGLGMLVAQAARSFQLWTGQAPPLAEMRAAAEAALAARADESAAP